MKNRLPVIAAVLTVILVSFPSEKHPVGVRVASVTPADIGAVLLVVVTFSRLVSGRSVDALRSKLLLLPVGVIAAALVTTMWSTNPVLSLVGVVRYAELFCLVPIAVVLAVRDRIDVLLILGAFTLLGTVEGVVGIYQTLAGTGAGYQGQTIRAIGTFPVSDALSLANVICYSQIVLIAVALIGHPRIRIYAAVAAGALFLPLLFTLTRGALLSLIVAGGMMLFLKGLAWAMRTFLVGTALVTVALIVAGGANNMLTDRYASIGSSATRPDRSVQDRYDLWATALDMWKSEPLTGVGIKQFPAHRDTFAPLTLSSGSELTTNTSYVRGELLSPHNEYLLLLSEQGVLGLAAYVAMQLALGFSLLRVLRTALGSNSPSDGVVERVLPVFAAGIWVWALCDQVYSDIAGQTAVLYAVLLGLQFRSAMGTTMKPGRQS